MSEPNIASGTRGKSSPGQLEGSSGESGKKEPGINKRADMKANQPVQRGTKWPSGKRKKKNMRDGKPIASSLTRVTGTCQAGCMAARVEGIDGKEPPRATRQKEANKAIKSSDLRQKMSAATAKYTAANRRLIVTE